ncbi:MAG: hypothetical protein MZU97_06395 [Bacillus subtilis]|nr:hypothetical protein [Bacillus subtilis]
MPGPGGPGHGPAWNHEALISPWRGLGPRPPAYAFAETELGAWNPGLSRPMLPARAARTPGPQKNLLRATRD